MQCHAKALTLHYTIAFWLTLQHALASQVEHTSIRRTVLHIATTDARTEILQVLHCKKIFISNIILMLTICIQF